MVLGVLGVIGVWGVPGVFGVLGVPGVVEDGGLAGVRALGGVLLPSSSLPEDVELSSIANMSFSSVVFSMSSSRGDDLDRDCCDRGVVSRYANRVRHGILRVFTLVDLGWLGWLDWLDWLG